MRWRFLISITVSSTLCGCASLSGSPAPLLSATEAKALVGGLSPAAVMTEIARSGTDRTVYRNRVVNSYLMALDANFYLFRQALSRGSKRGNIAFDLATLGLTGLASNWSGAAAELGALASATSGSKAVVNRELYFDKSLPALLSLMESKRMEVRADILRGLARSEGEYTIEQAFADLWRYQAAASIDSAIQETAVAAAAAEVDAERDLSKAKRFCRVEDAVGDKRRTIQSEVEAIAFTENDELNPEGAAKLRAAVEATGTTDVADATTTDEAWVQAKKVADHLLTLCSGASVAEFEAKLQTAGVL